MFLFKNEEELLTLTQSLSCMRSPMALARSGPSQLTHTKFTESLYLLPAAHAFICAAHGQHPPQPVYRWTTQILSA